MTLEEEIKKTVRDIPDFPKEGILFKDITPLLKDSILSEKIVAELARIGKENKIDAVVGIESRGFLYGMPVALAMGVPFVIIRKKGKLPADTYSVVYDLEYGSAEIEIHKDAFRQGWNVMLHDDLLATGGTAVAASELIEKAGASISVVSFLVDLSFLDGAKNIRPYCDNIIKLATY